MPPWNSMIKNDHADVDRNMEPLTRKNKERSRHGGGDGPQGNWIYYIYIYIYMYMYICKYHKIPAIYMEICICVLVYPVALRAISATVPTSFFVLACQRLHVSVDIRMSSPFWTYALCARTIELWD